MYAVDYFLSMIKYKMGKMVSPDGQTRAYIDEYAQVNLGCDYYQATIRTASCKVLTSGSKGSSCKGYRNALRAMHSQ